jgi:hypothetical protein
VDEEEEEEDPIMISQMESRDKVTVGEGDEDVEDLEEAIDRMVGQWVLLI